MRPRHTFMFYFLCIMQIMWGQSSLPTLLNQSWKGYIIYLLTYIQYNNLQPQIHFRKFSSNRIWSVSNQVSFFKKQCCYKHNRVKMACLLKLRFRSFALPTHFTILCYNKWLSKILFPSLDSIQLHQTPIFIYVLSKHLLNN